MATPLPVKVGFDVRVEDGTNGMVLVNVYDTVSGDLVGNPMRLHPSSGGDKIAADMPGVNPNLFVVNASNQITNG